MEQLSHDGRLPIIKNKSGEILRITKLSVVASFRVSPSIAGHFKKALVSYLDMGLPEECVGRWFLRVLLPATEILV
jgi:hypothetical protein